MRKSIFVFILSLIPVSIGLGLLDCSEEKDISITDPVYTISGFVKDSISGMPIDSAWININDSTPPYQAYTDSMGYYETSVFLGGQTTIFGGKDGYYIKDTAIYIKSNLDSINIKLSSN